MANFRDLGGNNRNGVDIQTETNRSGTITTGGTAQTLAATNPYRKRLVVQNIGTGDLWLSEVGTAAVDAAGSYKLAAGATATITSDAAVSIIGATTGAKFTATEE